VRSEGQAARHLGARPRMLLRRRGGSPGWARLDARASAPRRLGPGTSTSGLATGPFIEGSMHGTLVRSL